MKKYENSDTRKIYENIGHPKNVFFRICNTAHFFKMKIINNELKTQKYQTEKK